MTYRIESYASDIVDVLGLQDYDQLPYGHDTVGILDSEDGGIVAYIHADAAQHLLTVLNAGREETDWCSRCEETTVWSDDKCDKECGKVWGYE